MSTNNEQRLTDVLTKLNKETEKRNNNLESFGNQKLEHLETVDKYEQKLIAKIKDMAYNSRDEIRAKYEEDKSAIENELEPLNVVSNTVVDYLEKLEMTDNEQVLFVNTKISSSVAKDAEMLLQHAMDKLTEIETDFYLDTSLETDKTSLGRLEVRSPVKEYKATFQKNINIKRVGDIDTTIMDACLMDSNDLIIADKHNSIIKRYKSDLAFKDELKLSCMPVSVYNIGDNKVAVRFCHSNDVNIVSMDESMKVTSSFKITGNGNGMACDTASGEIYACGEDRLSVYSKTGNKLRTYDNDANGEPLFTGCVKVALSEDKQYIYLADRYEGLVVFDENGTIKMKVDVPGDGMTFPLCLLPGNICLVGRDAASTMIQLDKDGKLLGNIIDSNDGRTYTRSALYDRENSRLIVGGYPSVMSIYTISEK